MQVQVITLPIQRQIIIHLPTIRRATIHPVVHTPLPTIPQVVVILHQIQVMLHPEHTIIQLRSIILQDHILHRVQVAITHHMGLQVMVIPHQEQATVIQLQAAIIIPVLLIHLLLIHPQVESQAMVTQPQAGILIQLLQPIPTPHRMVPPAMAHLHMVPLHTVRLNILAHTVLLPMQPRGQLQVYQQKEGFWRLFWTS